MCAGEVARTTAGEDAGGTKVVLLKKDGKLA
jgi:hypothetical protein